MTIAPLLPFLAFSALFEVRTIPLDDPAAPVFLAHADADKSTDVFVLNGSRVSAWPAASTGEPVSALLQEGASGFDVCDLDGDGAAEVIAVCGDDIVSYSMEPAGSAPRVATLFKLRTQLAAPAVQPYPYVLIVMQSDPDTGQQAPALALPCENTFEIRRLDGTLVGSFPIGSGAVHRISYGSPFSVEWAESPQAGPSGSIEAEVSRVIAFEPELPPDFVPAVAQAFQYRRGAFPPPEPDVRDTPEMWPWFPLKTDGSTAMRALYALAAPDYGDSLVWVRDAKSDDVDLSGKSVVVGPERRYPGVLCVSTEDLPDFNGDGYVDLLLWHAPQAGMSIDWVTRLMLGHKWKLNLAVHLFNPEKNRFEPRAASYIGVSAPGEWFMSVTAAGPLRHVVLRDFDGDGRTDLGCSVSETEWSAWLFGEEGFGAGPDFEYKFEEPIERVEFRTNLDGTAPTTVALRTESALHVLRPAKK